LIERLRTSAAVIAAVAGAITGLWTIYEKVRSDARQYTADSYETLAPQINKMTEVLKQLEQENQQMRQALGAHATHPRTVAREKAAAAARPGATAASAPPPAGAAPAAGAPTAQNPAQAEPAADPDDPLARVIGTVNRTREAVDAIRKVPDTFQKVLEQKHP
jgi:hypothetical protein